MTTTEITTPEVVAEEYRHFTRICGVPHDRTITLLAEAFHITEHSVRRHLRHHRMATGALEWPNPTTAP